MVLAVEEVIEKDADADDDASRGEDPEELAGAFVLATPLLVPLLAGR
jgi:hypothetical protein